MERLTMDLGRALRRSRLRRGLTLRQLEEASEGRLKPTSVAGYERGERKITVERFCRLVSFYGDDPGRLLTEVLADASRVESGGALLDLTRLVIVLPDLEEEERRLVSGFVARIRERGEAPTDALRLDRQDLERLAAEAGRTPEELLALLRPALGEERPEPPR